MAIKRQMGRPTLEEAGALKERLLSSALDMLCHQGIAGLSMDALAAKASVTKRTIYRHFESKMGLIDAVVDREINRLSSFPVTLPNKTDDPLTTLKAWSQNLFLLSLDKTTRQFAVFLSFERLTDPEISVMLQEWVARATGPVMDLIVKAQSAGQLRDGNPVHYKLLLLDLIQGSGNRLNYAVFDDNIMGGLSKDAYFTFRWTAFLRLAASDTWNAVISDIEKPEGSSAPE